MDVKNLKKRLKYITELRKSTTLEIKSITNELIKIKNKRINRNKKELRDYYQENKFYGVKDIRNLFDNDYDDDDYVYDGIRQFFLVKTKKESFKSNLSKNKFYGVKDIRNLFDNDDDDDDDDDNDDDIYAGTEYLFHEEIMYYSFKNNGLEYDEIKKLMLVITKKECSKYGIEYNELIEDKKDEEFSKNGLKYEEIKRLLGIVLKKEENKYLSCKNGLEYDEIKTLMLVIIKKECSKYGIEYNELIED